MESSYVCDGKEAPVSKLGDMAHKIKEMAKAHPEQVDKGVARAERLVDERTGNRYDAKTDRAAETIRRSYREDDK